MIARLALAHSKKPYLSNTIDIHRRAEQLDPAYVRINPNMTVPSLVVGDRLLTESRDIALFALPPAPADEAEVNSLLDRHYGFEIEDLTMSWLMSWNPMVKQVLPRAIKKAQRRLAELADKHPDLRDTYLARAKVFARREQTFDPAGAARLFGARKATALGLLDHLEQTLSDGRKTLVPSGHSAADVVWTVFMGRLAFIRMSGEIERRPKLNAYWRAATATPEHEQADIWTSFSLFRFIKQVF